MNTTKLTLKNMIFYGHHGVFPAEKELGQEIVVDVEFISDFSEAGLKDDLNLTVNYANVYQLVRQIVEKEQFDLIEGIAMAIHNRLSEKFNCTALTVRVKKPQPPVGGVMEAAEFEISREFQ